MCYAVLSCAKLWGWGWGLGLGIEMGMGARQILCLVSPPHLQYEMEQNVASQKVCKCLPTQTHTHMHTHTAGQAEAPVRSALANTPLSVSWWQALAGGGEGWRCGAVLSKRGVRDEKKLPGRCAQCLRAIGLANGVLCVWMDAECSRKHKRKMMLPD